MPKKKISAKRAQRIAIQNQKIHGGTNRGDVIAGSDNSSLRAQLLTAVDSGRGKDILSEVSCVQKLTQLHRFATGKDAMSEWHRDDITQGLNKLGLASPQLT